VAVLFVLILEAECAIFSQLSTPWSNLWPLLIPGNSIGVMVGSIVRETLREIRTQNVRNVGADGTSEASDV
jgi:hypothetical protein